MPKGNPRCPLCGKQYAHIQQAVACELKHILIEGKEALQIEPYITIKSAVTLKDGRRITYTRTQKKSAVKKDRRKEAKKCLARKKAK